MLYVISIFTAVLSIFSIFTSTDISFPAKSHTFIFSDLFVVYILLKVFSSSDNFQPSISCTFSLAVIFTSTSLLVISVSLYETLTSGTILSIFIILIIVWVLFPAKSYTVIFSSVFSVYVLLNLFPSSDNFHPSISCIFLFAFIVTSTSSFVILVVLYFVSIFTTVLSMFSTFISTELLFPAKSYTFIFSDLFVVYVLLNVFLSSDNFHPSISCIFSLAIIFTSISLFVIPVSLYVTLISGAILSIFSTFIFAWVLFPTKSYTVIFSSVFSVYVLLKVFPSSDNFQPSIFCIFSLAVIVTITFPFVFLIVLYFTWISGEILSRFIANDSAVSFPIWLNAAEVKCIVLSG